jgi:hypothetical protein
VAKRAAASTRRAKRSAKATRAKAKKGTARKAVKKTTVKKRAAKKSAAKTAAKTKATKRRKPAAQPSRLSAAATLVRGAAAEAVVAIAERLPWAKDENDPIVLLETDHRRFENLLKQGEATTERAVKGRARLLATLKAALDVHELIEEKILYPALKSHPEARDIVLEGYQEHHVADLIVAELTRVATDDEKWGAKFKVLKENIEHHIEEEEGQMFRTARGIFSREELQELGARMKALKAKQEA